MLVSSYHRNPKMSTVFLKKIYYAFCGKKERKWCYAFVAPLNFCFL